MSDLIVETKLYNLSTRSSCGNILNSDPNYKSWIQYCVPNLIERDETIEYVHFSVPDAVIPVSFYTVNQNNCELDITIGGVVSSYLFPYGNYTASTFITEFINLLGSHWSLSLNTFNSTFTINNSATAFTLNATSSIASVMGFSASVSSSSSAAPYTLTLPRCCNFLPLPRITIRCPELANTQMVGASNSNDVLITIPNNAKPNGQIYYQNTSLAKLLFRRHDTTCFTVRFTDDDGNLLNFNGISSFFTFQFDIFRKYMPKPPRFSEILAIANANSLGGRRKYIQLGEQEETVEDNI